MASAGASTEAAANSVHCSIAPFSASSRGPRSPPSVRARCSVMASDSVSTRSPSVSTGTDPIGFSRRNSGERVLSGAPSAVGSSSR